MPFTVFIKGMVCRRCKSVVTQIFTANGYPPSQVKLGEITLESEPDPPQLKLLGQDLKAQGFELISDNRSKTVMKIKASLIRLFDSDSFELKIKLSEYLTDALHYEYHYLSKLFSEMEHTTIEKHFIRLKVEKVKELIEQGDLTLSEISYKLSYSSPAHLTNQFRQITGITPSNYKKMNARDRRQLEDL